MELLIALVLLSMVVLGISNIEVFCRYVFTGTDRKARIINDASYIVEHMSKMIGSAVGDGNNTPVTFGTWSGKCTLAVRAYRDFDCGACSNRIDGVLDDSDHEFIYCFSNSNHSLFYYPDEDATPQPAPPELMSRNVLSFNVSLQGNAVQVNFTECWNASGACGSVDNPSVTLQTRIFMPSVSTNATP
jgi:hypothetical protein